MVRCLAGSAGGVVMDDGGHTSEQIITSFNGLWHLVKPGGLYCIEDLGVAYGAGSVFESMLSIALTLRGARVHTLICDRALPGCQRAEFADVPDPSVLVEYRLQERMCDRCYATGEYHFDPLGLTIHRVGGLATRGPSSR